MKAYNRLFENINEELLGFIHETPTAFHCAENVKRILLQNGFVLRNPGEGELSGGMKCCYVFGNSAVIAVELPKDMQNARLRVTAVHGDSPALKLKPTAECEVSSLTVLSTERYGGLINSSWLDRPLSIAGRIVFRDGDKVKSINVQPDGYAVIPNVAIHQNRKINSGFEYNPQTDLRALWSGSGKPLKKRLSEAAGVNEEDILDTDLYLVNGEKGMIWGAEGEFISAPRLDDLQCVYAGLCGFLSSNESKGIKIFTVFDSEEVGSRSVSGADSIILYETVREIADRFGLNVLQLSENGRLLSADNAHALHPLHPELSEPNDRPVMNGGVVIKYNSNQNYITNALGGAEFRLMCEKEGVKYQVFANRSDMAGGSTLGSISATQLPLTGVDIGVAQLAMHSCYETAGAHDTVALAEAVRAFYLN